MAAILIVIHLYCSSKHKFFGIRRANATNLLVCHINFLIQNMMPFHHHFLCMTNRFTNPFDIFFFSLLISTDILLFINHLFCLENAEEKEKRQFLQEIDLMKDVGSHGNIVSMLGFWIRSEPIMLIMEYVPHGDLLQWLRNKRQQIKLVFVCIHFFCYFRPNIKSGFL